jgi:hypothetical protein
MPRYSAYYLNNAGKIASTELIQASSDDEAVEAARAFNDSARCEVWERKRFVGRVIPELAQSDVSRVTHAP